MLASIAVLLVLAGISSFLFGLVRAFFPSANKFIPDDFKTFLTIKVGLYLFLAGVVLLRFF